MLMVERREFGTADTTWFGYTYSKDGMRIDPSKVRSMGESTRPKDKAVQTV